MNINRDNYEEYFLLYADNELADSEKAEVLLFVKHNKDLEQEFRMIHHTISKPGAGVQLNDKSFLFRTTQKSFINETNYEAVFVLYHDNELTESQKSETEDFLVIHKELKNEFDLIAMARLTPESAVVFPGKKILYRKEKSGKVTPIMFWRMLAAAVFIGLGLWITSIYFQTPIKSNTTTVHANPVKTLSPKTDTNIAPEKKPVEIVVQSPTIPGNNAVKETFNKKQKPVYRNTNNAVVKTNIDTKNQEENITNQLPEKINDAITVSDTRIKNISKEETSSLSKIDPSKELALNEIVTNNQNNDPATYTKNTSYITDADNKNGNYVFYDVPAEKFKKTKVGGFLKKVKRVVERNNPIARLLSGNERQVVSR